MFTISTIIITIITTTTTTITICKADGREGVSAREGPSQVAINDRWLSLYLSIYIYIYIEREREIGIDI